MRRAGGPARALPLVTTRAAPRASARRNFDRAAMRRAAALYLLSREALARDVTFLLLPDPAEADRRPAATSRGTDARGAPAGAVRSGAADLVLWARGRALLVGFVPSRDQPSPVQQRLAVALRGLGHEYRMLHAETPAHAVELLARLIDGEGR